MAGFTVRPDGIRIAITNPRNSGHRDLLRRRDAVVARAKILCPVDTGRLQSTIGATDPQPTRQGLTITVYALTDYAAAVHEGRGSRFAPRSWRRRGPGPRRFLTNALSAAGGRVRVRRGR